MPCSHPATSALERKHSLHKHPSLLCGGWGGNSGVEDSNIRGTVLSGCLLSLPLLQGHLRVWLSCQLPSEAAHFTCPRPPKLHDSSPSFIWKMAGRAGNSGATLVGRGGGSERPAGVVLGYPPGDCSPLWPQSSLAEDSDCN